MGRSGVEGSGPTLGQARSVGPGELGRVQARGTSFLSLSWMLRSWAVAAGTGANIERKFGHELSW